MSRITEHFIESRDAFNSIYPDQLHTLEAMAMHICDAIRGGHKVFLCGNGGSAADAQHIAAELVVRFKQDRRAYPAIALTTDTSILTAAGNDYSFSDIFSRQIEALGSPADVLIALSTSGQSTNVIEAAKAAHRKGMITFAFTGEDPSLLARGADQCFQAGRTTAITQQLHMVALHAMCDFIEDEMTRK